MKKLYKSRHDKVLDGVCSGMADYLGMDATLMRIIWVLLTIFASAFIGGIIIYVICSLIIPREPLARDKKKVADREEINSSQEETKAQAIDHEATEHEDVLAERDNPEEDPFASSDLELQESTFPENEPSESYESSAKSSAHVTEAKQTNKKKETSNGTVVAGIIFIILGTAFLLGNLLDLSISFNINQIFHYIRDLQDLIRGFFYSLRNIKDYFIPMLLIGIGLLILVKRK